jgi:hypothetical protein
VLAGAWLIAQESYLGFSRHPFPTIETWQVGALFTIACLWAVYAFGVCALGFRLRHPAFRFGAFTVAALATVLPIWAALALPAAGWPPFWNLRWLSYLVVGLTLGLLSAFLAKEREALEEEEADALGALPVLTSLVALAGLSIETYAGFGWWAGSAAGDWKAAAVYALVFLWSVFATGLLLLGLAWKQGGLRAMAYYVGGAALAVLLVNTLAATGAAWPPVANLRFLAFAAAAAMLVFGTAVLDPRKAELNAMESGLPLFTRWLALLLVLWGLTLESYETFRYFRDLFGTRWDRAAQMGISLVWTLCGVLLLVAGVVRSYQPVRLFALGLLGLTVLKVFLFDLSFLDMAYRILSFGGLGIALIGISWLYSRYGIGKEAPTAKA